MSLLSKSLILVWSQSRSDYQFCVKSLSITCYLRAKRKGIYTEQDRPLSKSYLEFQEWRKWTEHIEFFFSCALKQWSPTILAPVKFSVRKFFQGWVGGVGFWMIRVWHLLCTYFLLLHQPSSDQQVLDTRGWGYLLKAPRLDRGAKYCRSRIVLGKQVLWRPVFWSWLIIWSQECHLTYLSLVLLNHKNEKKIELDNL